MKLIDKFALVAEIERKRRGGLSMDLLGISFQMLAIWIMLIIISWQLQEIIKKLK